MNNTIIKSTVELGLCAGCGTCDSLCPNNAIRIELQERKGIYLPRFLENKCSNCGTCTKVCPGHEVDFDTLNLFLFKKRPNNILLGNYIDCFLSYSEDTHIRYDSSSGGVITQILIFALEEGLITGALVTKADEHNPLMPKPFIAKTKEELISSARSKYCPVPVNIALNSIINSSQDEKYAVVGLPCHIQGIRKAEQLNDDLQKKIVLHLGLFCSNTPNFLATDYILKEFSIDKNSVRRLDYRGKGWPGGLQVETNGKIIFIPFHEYWNKGFGQYFSIPRCKYCVDPTCELADMSFADAWLPEIRAVDSEGSSLIISRTNLGQQILEAMYSKNKISLRRIPSEKIIKSQGRLINRKIEPKKRYPFVSTSRIPKYNSQFIDTLSPTSGTLGLYVGSLLASRKSLWRFLSAYVKLINHIKNR